MQNLFEKETFTQEDIQSFIDNELEESIHLDFKSAESLDRSDGKKKELSKDISAFANSDGGLIIYGISEKDHKANCLSFVDGKVFTKEWIEQLANTTIQRRIPDLLIFPVRFDSKIDQTVYVVKIPKSHDAPHMARDNRFYKRFNFESVMMEEYEVRELYGRRSKSKLEIDGESIGIMNSSHRHYEEGKLGLSFEVSIGNDGDLPEPEYKVNLYFENSENIQIMWDAITDRYHTTKYGRSRVKISAHNNPTIYPDEKVDVIKISILINKFLAIETLKNLKYEIKLLYGSGQSSRFGDFEEVLDLIQKNNFL